MVNLLTISEHKALGLLVLSPLVLALGLALPSTRAFVRSAFSSYPISSLGTAVGLTALWGVTLKSIAQGPQCRIRAKLSGKVVIVTGASSGIGVTTSAELAKMGADVVMACRGLSKAEKAKKEICANTIGLENRLHIMELDLADLASIRSFVKAFKEKFDRLDILVNNAGVVPKAFNKTVDGFEMQFGVNHLGHFYLTWNLLDYIELYEGRVVNVSSIAATFTKKIDLVTTSDAKGYHGFKAYTNSKLANVLFTVELQRRFEEKKSRATAYCVHPGFVFTEIGRDDPGFSKVVGTLDLLVCKTKLSGCQTTLHCAVDPDVVPGKMYADCQIFTGISSDAVSPAAAKELWDTSVELLKL